MANEPYTNRALLYDWCITWSSFVILSIIFSFGRGYRDTEEFQTYLPLDVMNAVTICSRVTFVTHIICDPYSFMTTGQCRGHSSYNFEWFSLD